MATPTYDLLNSTTLGTAAASLTFSGISGSYGDLVLVISGTVTSSNITLAIRFNGDTGSNYFSVNMRGDGSAASSTSWSSISLGYHGAFDTNQGLSIINIMDYAATNKHKTILSRTGSSSFDVRAHAVRWADTSAITSITLLTDGAPIYDTGTTFQLFGVAK